MTAPKPVVLCILDGWGLSEDTRSNAPFLADTPTFDAVMTNADQVPFAVSKGGLNQLTKVLSLSLAEHGVRVNAIGPGSIMTDHTKQSLEVAGARKRVLDRTPLGRIGAPEEIAGIAAFLASDAASYVTGQCIYADGGRLVQDVRVRPKD